MASVNKAILVGHLGKDPELRHTSGGAAVCNFSLATSESWANKEGKKEERTEWHNIQVWNKAGESCAQYLSKGSLIYLEGQIRTRSYEKDSVKHYVTEIVAQRVQFLSTKKGANGRNEAAADNGEMGGAQPGYDDDVPF